jgi:hypothetical protein
MVSWAWDMQQYHEYEGSSAMQPPPTLTPNYAATLSTNGKSFLVLSLFTTVVCAGQQTQATTTTDYSQSEWYFKASAQNVDPALDISKVNESEHVPLS